MIIGDRIMVLTMDEGFARRMGLDPADLVGRLGTVTRTGAEDDYLLSPFSNLIAVQVDGRGEYLFLESEITLLTDDDTAPLKAP